MKKNRSKKSAGSPKALVIASVIGAAAIGAATLAAYNSTMRRLVPTNTSGDAQKTWVFEEKQSDSSEPSAAAVADADSDIEETLQAQEVLSDEFEESAEEVNRPVQAAIGNIMPVEGEVSNPFSDGELVKSETLGVWKTHDGCDIACPIGTDVKSMSNGVVAEIKDDPLWGICVSVEQNNGLWVQYCGLAKELSVKAGQEIKQGEIIGKTGDTCQVEIAQSPHLHLGVKQGGKWVDPILMIEDGE